MDSIFKDAEKEINGRLKSMDIEGNISIGKPVQLGELFSITDACAFGIIVPTTVGTQTTKTGGAVMLMRVNSRLVFAYVYAEYKGPDTFHYLGQVAERWARQILAANPR